VFTDALNMKGVANADKPGEIELRALLAGNDVMLFPQDPVKAIERIQTAVDFRPGGPCSDRPQVLEGAARQGVGRAGPERAARGRTEDLHADLNTTQSKLLRRNLYGARHHCRSMIAMACCHSPTLGYAEGRLGGHRR
jgi:beta-N-acetylhexosaminidase